MKKITCLILFLSLFHPAFCAQLIKADSTDHTVQAKDSKQKTLEFDTLVQFHKQEGAEELTYITIIFTVALGLLGYLGSAHHVDKWARIILAIGFVLFQLTFTV